MSTGDTSPSDKRASDAALYVDFAGEEYLATPDNDFTFGRHRACDLVLDADNRYLHRRLGRFAYSDEQWWLINEGSSLELRLLDSESRTNSTITAGQNTPVHFESFSIRLTAGPTTYELLVDQPLVAVGPLPTELEATMTETSSERTINASGVALSDNQFALLVACTRPLLLDPDAPMPTSGALAESLGWSSRKFERQLDRVCAKFAQSGYPGLHGHSEKKAMNRKVSLAELAIQLDLVKASDVR